MEPDLLSVEKPARYMGNEMGIVVKPDAELRIALAFPDVYEVGMSHLGLRILYHILNQQEGLAAERVYAPWPDMAAQMAERRISLATLETATPLAKTDIIGFTLQYELSCTNIITMLDQAGIPRRAKDRDASWPLVLGGGPGAYNPEPLAQFFDVFLLGDGEEAVVEIADVYRKWKCSGSKDKQDLFQRLSEICGIYVPSFFETEYHPDGRVLAIRALREGYKSVKRRFLSDLESAPYPDSPVVPFLKTVHDRVAMEIARGCTRGCRFCQAGYLYRPLRERSPDKLRELIRSSLSSTGYDEISLLSLSTGDYSCIEPLLRGLMSEYSDSRIAVSLPSLRVGTLTPELIEEIKRVRKTGFTLAPEAGSERLRQVINKGISEADLLEGAFNVYSAGWRSIKLYFMMGLPTETREDILAICDLARQVKAQARRAGTHGEVNVAVSTFVPKPHTPFQRERQLGLEETREYQRLLRDEMKRRKLNYKYQEAELSFVEGVFARGDRRLADLLECAVDLGCRFDGWREHFSMERWMQAFTETGMDPAWYLRKRESDEILPWDHLDSAVSRDFLESELDRAMSGTATADCRFGHCTLCGVCDFKTLKNRVAQPEPESSVVSSVEHQKTHEPLARRVRIRFSRNGRLSYLSHLELINLLTRAVHRAGIPVLYTQGFHPHPRFSFATATSVGVESQAEYLDLFVDAMGPELCKELLNRVLPAGMKVLEAWGVEMKAPSLSAMIEATRFRILLPGMDAEQLKQQCVQFMAQSSWQLVREKKGQRQIIDLRAEIRALEAVGESLEMVIGRGKPYEVAAAVTGMPGEELKKLPVEKLDVLFSVSMLENA